MTSQKELRKWESSFVICSRIWERDKKNAEYYVGDYSNVTSTKFAHLDWNLAEQFFALLIIF